MNRLIYWMSLLYTFASARSGDDMEWDLVNNNEVSRCDGLTDVERL